LEKFEMKKTLVAVAAVVATTGAFAEAVISGGVDYGYVKSTTGSTVSNIMAGDTNQFNNLAVSASEDLGNGMMAKAKYDLGIGYTEGAGAGYTRESWVGLSGPFGDLSLGRQYTPIFLAATVDPIGLPAKSVGQEGLVAVFLTGTGGAGTTRDVRANSSFSYTTPAFSGIKLNVFNAMSGVQNTATVGYTSAYGVSYAADALSLNYVRQTTDLEGISNFHADNIAGTSTFNAGSGDTVRSMLAASYDAGFAKFVFINGEASNSDLKVSTNYFAIGFPVPGTNLSLAASVNSSTVTDETTAANDATVTGAMLKANYAFSKRTNVYMIYGQDKSNNGDGLDTARTTTTTTFGLSHTF